MKKTHWLGALAALAVTTTAGFAGASSHREAPAISNDPVADNTDLYAFLNPAKDKLVIVANYIPLEEPAGGPNFNKFSDQVLYEIHIARGTGDAADPSKGLDDVITYQIAFSNAPITRVSPGDGKTAPPDPPGGGGTEFFSQITGYIVQTYTVTRIDAGKAPVAVATGAFVAPPNIGKRTSAQAYPLVGGLAKWPSDPTDATYDDTFANAFIATTSEGGSVFAGPRDDPFFVDLGAIFDLADLRALGPTGGKDAVAGYNTHSIVLEIPVTKLTAGGAAPAGDGDILGVWASASRRKVRVLRNDGTEAGYGPWTQVSRLGLPLINEAMIGIQDKDKWNRLKPSNDYTTFAPYFLAPVLVRDARFEHLYDATGPLGGVTPVPDANRLDIVTAINLGNANIHSIGDVLRVDMSKATTFPNGRALADDVTDVLLSLILTKKTSGVGDGVSTNDKAFTTAMPYVALPWDGFGNTHGLAK